MRLALAPEQSSKDTLALRNIAIIAHVDHGKTTLVDAMLSQTGRLSSHRSTVERILDSDDLERERGITILGKATSVQWHKTKINIADTPGHADFGGEVERMLTMVDGVLLLVDAAEGPLPQTRFVLGKALARGLPALVAINKIDRSDARSDAVLNEVYDLFIDLGASEEQIEFPVFYTNARAGTATDDLSKPGRDLSTLLDAIVEHIPPPSGQIENHLQALIANIDDNDYVGRLGLGRIWQGRLREGEIVAVIGAEETRNLRIGQLYTFEGLERSRVKEVPVGDLFAIAGIEDIQIGDTLADPEHPSALPRVTVDEPTIAMFFIANNGPLAGLDGRYVTSRNIRERLFKELRGNVSLRVEETQSSDTFKVVGRGELALSVLIENMRREGYELCVSKPEVVTKTDDAGRLLEPMEKLILDVPETCMGVITEKLARRKGRMSAMKTLSAGEVRLEYDIPSRGLIGFRGEFLNDTRGLGVLNTLFNGWQPWQGDIIYRQTGSIVSDRLGKTTIYALYHLQPRGSLFVGAGTEVYEGMIIGEHAKNRDIDVNATKEKKLTNVRAAGKDEALALTPYRDLTLEQALQWIGEGELVEITPHHLRLRKKELTAGGRSRRRH